MTLRDFIFLLTHQLQAADHDSAKRKVIYGVFGSHFPVSALVKDSIYLISKPERWLRIGHRDIADLNAFVEQRTNE